MQLIVIFDRNFKGIRILGIELERLTEIDDTVRILHSLGLVLLTRESIAKLQLDVRIIVSDDTVLAFEVSSRFDFDREFAHVELMLDEKGV